MDVSLKRWILRGRWIMNVKTDERKALISENPSASRYGNVNRV